MSALTNEQLVANAREREHSELDEHGSHFWRCVPLTDAIYALDAATRREAELRRQVLVVRQFVDLHARLTGAKRLDADKVLSLLDDILEGDA